MIAELVHTSLPRGLDGGTGFTVAGRTGGMPRALIDALSALSGLPEAWQGASDAARAMHATRCIQWQGVARWVASVIRPCGVDHTGRGNRIAHHRLLESSEIEHACPVAILQDAARWMPAWSGAPREMDPPPSIGAMPGAAGATLWKRMLGDEGVADAALEVAMRSGVGAWVVVPTGCDRLQLLAELVGALSLRERWTRGWSTRALRPSGGPAPMICVIDAQEPALESLGNPAWVIRADSLRPKRRATRGPTLEHGASISPAATGRITWEPERRLGVASAPAVDAPAAAVPDHTEPVEGSAEREIAVAVTLEEAPASRGKAFLWAAVALGLMATVGWLLWKARGA